MGEHRHFKADGRLDLPIIKDLRTKYEDMFLFGDIEDMCKKFGVDEKRIRRLIYSKSKHDQAELSMDYIIRLSNMFDIPYEEFVNYNAFLRFSRDKDIEKQREENDMVTQYAIGKKWEEEVLHYYAKKGYFTYKIPTMNSGTVFDIFVARGGACLMIECKHIEGDKLYYAGSGLLKKTDEIDHFIQTTNNNVYLYVNSDVTGSFWTTWLKAKPILVEKGYITKEDCFPCNLNNLESEEE
jgi:plasmid maintenance system antidote protein VapI